MKLTQIHAQHFLGAPPRAIPLRAPVVCIAGPNGAGKSSLIEAIRFCLTGQAPREVTLKGDYDQLLTLGATKGTVSVTTDDDTLVRDVRSGKLIAGEPLPEAVADWLPTLLDAHTFTRMDGKAQRAFMFKLLQISMGWPVVKAELEREGVSERLVDTIAAPIRGGWDAAASFADGKATEARGAWRGVTGARQYGSQIAADWKAPGADKPEVEVNTKVQEGRVELARSVLHDAQQVAADRKAKRSAYLLAEEQLKDAPKPKALVKRVDDLKAVIATTETRIAELEKLAEAKSGTTAPCPHCGESITFDRGEFHAAAPGGAVATPAHLEELHRLRRELPGHRQALGAEERYKARIDALREAAPAPVTERDVTDAEAAVTEAARALTEASNALRDASAEAAEVAEAKRKTAEAAEHHAEVEAWTALHKLLLPTGIPTTLLLRGLAPFNKQLEALANEVGWETPRLGPDFVVRVGDIAYRLLSESEQWRVDALIAAAIAIKSGVKLLLLDRFDVLDVPGRNALLGWLGAAGKSLFDTVIVAGTLKAKPVQLTEMFGIHVLWLDGAPAPRPAEEEPEDATPENEDTPA